MRSFFRSFLRRRPFQRVNEPNQNPKVSATQATTMAGSMTAAALYACSMSSPSALGAVPEDAPDKKHHLKSGVGFQNPWESWKELSGPKIGGAVIWYCQPPKFFSIAECTDISKQGENNRQAQVAKHQPAHSSSSRTYLSPLPNDLPIPPRNMARPCMLLCRISQRSARAF
jgi:hypothetical protein